MKALVLKAPKTLVLEERKMQSPNADYDALSINVVGIGGSEYLAYRNPGMRNLPNVMGHGLCGKLASGTRVAVFPLCGCGHCHYCGANNSQLCERWSLIGVQRDGGFQQSICVPKSHCVPIPESISWEQSAFIEPFANSVNAWDRSGANDKSSIGVVGLGGLGIGITLLANKFGCKTIHVADLSTERCKAGTEAGATVSGEALTDIYDVVFDTVGSVETRSISLNKTRKGGTCVMLGFGAVDFYIDAIAFTRHQKTLVGSFAYSMEQFCIAVTLASLSNSRWVRSLESLDVEEVLNKYLRNDFDIVKAALRPNEKWVTDVSFVPTDEGWLYVATILDLYNREVVGWAMDASNDQNLTARALTMALETHQPPDGLLHHSDRGSTYTAHDYRKLLADNGIECSMSRKGDCWDNAVAESFFSTLKKDLVHRHKFKTRRQAAAAIFEYLEVFYNRIRLHSTLGNKTPVGYRIENTTPVTSA